MHDKTDLCDHPILGFEEELSRLPEARYLAEAARTSDVPFASNSLLALREAAAAGLGLAVLPCMLGDRDTRLQRAWPTPLGTRPIWLVYPAELQRHTPVRDALSFLSTLFKDNADLLAGRAA